MDINQFKKEAHNLVDWMFEYHNNITKYPIKSKVKPGEIYDSLQGSIPENGESFDKIFQDFENKIMPGITHWQNPNFYAFFPANNSFPSILAEMLISTIGAQCMMWDTSPAATELEEKVTDWLRDFMGLPSSWKGVINDTASIGTICSLLTARELKNSFKSNSDGINNNRYRVYGSTEAHSSIEKAVKIIGIGSKNYIKINTNSDLSIDINDLEKKINEDINNGYVPIAIISTFGTTGTVSFDDINKTCLLANKYKIWHHIDAAYAGSVLIVDEYKKYIKNIDLADSFLFNPHKWLLTNFDCSLYYVKDHNLLTKTLEIHPEYLKSSNKKKIKNYKDWSLQLGRRFRALKLWFVLRTYGKKGLKKYILNHINLAKYLNKKIKSDKNFEITCNQNINMINFRLRPYNSNIKNEDLDKLNFDLISKLNNTGKIYISHTKVDNKVSIRMPIGSTFADKKNVDESWDLIKKTSNNIIKKN